MTYFGAARRNMTAKAQDSCAMSSCTKMTAMMILGAAIAASIFALLQIIILGGSEEHSRESTSGFARGTA